MMTAQTLRRYLAKPRLLYDLPLAELQELALRYPYAPNIRMLLLLKAHLEGHPDEEAYLNRCAAASFDRAHLWDVLRELDLEVQEEEVVQGEVLELRELDALDLDPLLAEEPEAFLEPPAESSLPSTVPVESYTADYRNEPELDSEPALEDNIELRRDTTSKETSDVSIESVEITTPQKDNVVVVGGVKLQQRLARIRQRQEERLGKENKEDVNRIARRSVVAQEEVASETLAGLLVRQGQYQNAIRMYQRLILLNPEKKSIFAGLINDLKEKL